ncbi:MAG TPA: phosphatase PAP2 family protein [Streptosporangiaceae bacterium]|nr:phosphatase PAP2 family protein [Streptosporangiaceae bacterium]
MTMAGVLADPRVRLGAGTAALLITAVTVHQDRVGPGEAAAFRAVNGLPESLYRPAWAVMQLGTIGAAPATAAAAWLAGDRELAGRLLAGGTGAWALSKVVKRMVRRPRPAVLLPGTRRRGREASGLGYLSGHAGVAVALGTAALPHLGPAGRALTLGTVPVVGLTRIYVGAHLPLDVAGGAALGLVIDAALTLASSAWQAEHPRRQRQPETEFQTGLRKFSMLLVQVAGVLTGVIFVINVTLHRPVIDAVLFTPARRCSGPAGSWSPWPPRPW